MRVVFLFKKKNPNNHNTNSFRENKRKNLKNHQVIQSVDKFKIFKISILDQFLIKIFLSTLQVSKKKFTVKLSPIIYLPSSCTPCDKSSRQILESPLRVITGCDSNKIGQPIVIRHVLKESISNRKPRIYPGKTREHFLPVVPRTT